jgi:hypothetical protein
MKNFIFGLVIGILSTALSVQFCPHWKSSDKDAADRVVCPVEPPFNIEFPPYFRDKEDLGKFIEDQNDLYKIGEIRKLNN